MIQISESAQSHFRRLIEREALPGLGVRLSAVHPGTPRADVRLEFAEPGDLRRRQAMLVAAARHATGLGEGDQIGHGRLLAMRGS